MSRTEELLTALVAALDAKARVDAVRSRYEKFHPASVGEPPLDQALQAPTEHYVKALDRLRATLTSCGVVI